jgi:plastocyanin
MKHHCRAISLFLLLSFGTSSSAFSQEWADLTMTVVLDGDIPEKQEIVIPVGVRGPAKIESEVLVVDPVTNGIANMVFMIDSKKTKLAASQLHPDLQDIREEKPVLECKNLAFVPHVLAMRAGQTLLVKSAGPNMHNPKFSFFKNDEVGQFVRAGADREIVTRVEEPGPTKVECSIYPWMTGFVIVAGHPYVGISDAKGTIKIEKLPAGVPLHFKIWHESQDKSIEELSVGGKKETWKKGAVELTLKEGANDLGTILIKPDRFKRK